MTDITDEDRRAARVWAKNWQGDQDDDTSAAARVILADVQKQLDDVQKGAESNAETLDPADVPPGEAWVVEVFGERRTAVKDRVGDLAWNTFPAGGLLFPEENEDVILIDRLVPAHYNERN